MIISSSSAQILDFGVADQDAWFVRLSCGGEISGHKNLGSNENCLTLKLKPKPRLFIVGAVQSIVPSPLGEGRWL